MPTPFVVMSMVLWTFSLHFFEHVNRTFIFINFNCVLKFCCYILTCRYVALEDFENGIKSYQNALRIDSRHYNSWYGLGMIFLRQEKFEFSEHHFGMAFHINPRSSVIMSYLGTAMHALKVGLLSVLFIILCLEQYHLEEFF